MGSLAVEQIINFPTNPDDIDIQLKTPDFENFEQLTSLMEELGYQLIDLHEHKFEKDSIHVGFASVETLKNYEYSSPFSIQQERMENGEEYYLPNVEQSLKIYQAANRDDWRGGKQKDSFILDKLIKK